MRRLVDVRDNMIEDVWADSPLKNCCSRLKPPKRIDMPKRRRMLAKIPPIRDNLRIVTCPCTSSKMQDISWKRLLAACQTHNAAGRQEQSGRRQFEIVNKPPTQAPSNPATLDLYSFQDFEERRNSIVENVELPQ